MANVSAPSSAPSVGQGTNQTYFAALSMVTVLFFFWGFVTSLNDILIPHLKNIFELNYTKIMLIQFAFFTGYFVFSLPAAKIVDTFGYKKTMVIGLITMAVGAFGFLPAAMIPSYPFFLAALLIVAGGMTALQVSANAYVVVLGNPDTSSSRLNLTQAFNSFGTTIGPYLGGLFILKASSQTADAIKAMPAQALHAYRVQEASSVKMPYIVIGLSLLVFAVLIGLFKLPSMPHAERHHASGSIWKYTHLVLGAIGIFVYVGAEVSIGSFLINYLSQPDIGNLPEVIAARFVSCYWCGAMIGRFVGSAVLRGLTTAQLGLRILVTLGFVVVSALIPQRFVGGSETSGVQVLLGLLGLLHLLLPVFVLTAIALALLLLASLFNGGKIALGTGSLLGLCAVCTMLLVMTSMFSSGTLAMWSIIFVGLFNSIMFPSIFSLGLAKLGPLTGDGSGLLIAAIVGGALIPVAQGWIADHIGIHHAFILPVICYAYIVYYGLRGSRPVVPSGA